MKVFTSFGLFFLLIVGVGSHEINGIAPYYVKTTSIKCYGNPKMLVNITCSLKPINWEKTVAMMDSDLVGIVRNVSLHIELFKCSYTNQFHPFLINVTVNLCNIVETRRGNPYGKIIINILSRFTNVNHSCPFWGHLTACGLYLDPRFVPFVIPSAKYKAIFTFYEGWPMVHIGTTIMIASLIEKTYTPTTQQKTRPKRILFA